MYKVKLNAEHKASEGQITTDGYLKLFNVDAPMLYSKKDAKDKAKFFGGVIEECDFSFGIKNHILIEINTNEISDEKIVGFLNSFNKSKLIEIELFLELIHQNVRIATDDDYKRRLIELSQHVYKADNVIIS